jgi:hypothetical protein
MIAKVMVEIDDLERLKWAINVLDNVPKVEAFPFDWLKTAVSEVTEIARRAVAEEEKIQKLIDTPVDISSD